jgi:hypothetical protein
MYRNCNAIALFIMPCPHISVKAPPPHRREKLPPEIAVKVTNFLQACSHKLLNITQLRSNCRIIIPLPHISVIAFPPQAGGNCGKSYQCSPGGTTKRLNATRAARAVPGYALSAHFRESAASAGEVAAGNCGESYQI